MSLKPTHAAQQQQYPVSKNREPRKHSKLHKYAEIASKSRRHAEEGNVENIQNTDYVFSHYTVFRAFLAIIEKNKAQRKKT